MTDSVCFFLIQSYLPEQEKIDQLKNELLSLNCTLQRISGISLSKAKNNFFLNSGWIPMSNNNLVLHSAKMLSNAELKQIVAWLEPAQAVFLFCKKNHLIFNQKNLIAALQADSFVEQNNTFPFFFKQQITLPFTQSKTFLTKNWFFLLSKLLTIKQKA